MPRAKMAKEATACALAVERVLSSRRFAGVCIASQASKRPLDLLWATGGLFRVSLIRPSSTKKFRTLAACYTLSPKFNQSSYLANPESKSSLTLD